MSDELEPDEEHMLAAEYTLGLLTAAEARGFEALLDIDPATRTEYALWAENFASLTDDIAPVTPPATVLDALRDRLFAADAAPAPAARPSLLQRLGLLPAMGGGLVAALVALWVIGNFVPQDSDLATASARMVSADQSLIVEVAYVDNGETLQINRTAGAAPAGQVLQLWLLKEGQPPLSLGVLPDDAVATLAVAEDVRPLLRGARCAISAEPPGGSPTGAPTGAVLAEAPIVWEA